MANSFSPFGLQPVRRVDGAAWTLQLSTVLIAAANTHSFFRGDLVNVLSTGYIDRLAGSSNFAVTMAGIGVFWGMETIPGSSGSPWNITYPGVAQTIDTKAQIIMDPNVVFRCQVGTGAAPGSAGGPLTIASVWQNAPFINGTGNALSGQSGGYLDFANIATTNTLPLTIIGLVGNTTSGVNALQGPPQGVNGTDVTTAGNVVEVIFNQNLLKVGQTGV